MLVKSPAKHSWWGVRRSCFVTPVYVVKSSRHDQSSAYNIGIL